MNGEARTAASSRLTPNASSMARGGGCGTVETLEAALGRNGHQLLNPFRTRGGTS